MPDDPVATPTRLVLFDIDGTLLTSAGVAGRAIRRALEQAAGRPVDIGGYSFAGRTDPEIVGDLLRRAGFDGREVEERLQPTLDAYVDGFAAAVRGADGPRLFPGIRALLERLDAEPAVCVGLLTGNVERGAAIKLDLFGIRDYFEVGAYGSDSADRKRLVEVAVRRARALHGVDFAGRRVVVVGDTPRDIACAHHHGARCVAVATGPHSVDELRAHGAERAFADLSATEMVVRAILGG